MSAARYPLLLDLTDRPVLVVGGGPVAARRALGALAAGALVHVIAPAICEDLADEVQAGRLRWTPREATAADVTPGSGPTSDPTRPAPPGSGPTSDPTRRADGARSRIGAGDAARSETRPDSYGARSETGPGSHGARSETGPGSHGARSDTGCASGAAPTSAPAPTPARADAAHPAHPTPQRWWLVHTATGDPGTDAAIAEACDAAGIWCVRADRAAASPAHVPATATGPDGVQVAVSGGGDPGRARAIRDTIAADMATGHLPLRRTRRSPGTGHVVLVGGGPGHPGLITVTGRQWLARADVVVADRLGPTGLLAELRPEVEVIDVGKAAGHHPIPQQEINRILVDRARAGQTVVRLKGGDPFVLGRGGEEALHCRANGVAVEVVPGVTSAVSVPAAAGIPVTHRGASTSFVVATAHAGASHALDAARDAPADATLVLLMGLSTLARTAGELIGAGRDPATPVAVVSSGWTPEQRTVTGTLATIAEDVAWAGLETPVVIVVGEVVGLRTALGDLAGPAAARHAAATVASPPGSHATAAEPQAPPRHRPDAPPQLSGPPVPAGPPCRATGTPPPHPALLPTG